MASQQQSNSAEQTTGVFTDTKRTETKSGNWIDTVSDWDEVLDPTLSADAVIDADRSVSSTNGQPSPHVTQHENENGDGVATVPSTRDDLPAGVETLARIEPISDELLDATIETLPSEWLTDTETQTVVQQLVYRFVEHTSKAEPAHDRLQSVCDEMDADSLAHLCTAPLYDDRSEMWTEYLEDDLETIEKRLSQ